MKFFRQYEESLKIQDLVGVFIVTKINNMGNRTITQKPPERQTRQKQKLTPSTSFQDLNDFSTTTVEQSQHIITPAPFQSLDELPILLSGSQCVLHKNEILICGGENERSCYSYHTIKNEYKFICSYPSDVILEGHCVVKLAENNNKDNNDISEITLLSFGGKYKHTLVMKYVNFWNSENYLKVKRYFNMLEYNGTIGVEELNEPDKYNIWIPLTDNHNHSISIGRDEDQYLGVRAVIGGSNNHLLFITYYKNNISVFDLNTFQFIKHDTLPTNNYIRYHCFVSNSENGQEMMKINQEKKKKKSYEMLLFCKKTGLSIKYDEDNNAFRFHRLPVFDDISPFNKYAYVRVNDVILFFGGCCWRGDMRIVSKALHRYFIQRNTWITFEYTLSTPLYNCFGILDEDNTNIHIIGGSNNDKGMIFNHMKTNVSEWIYPQLVNFLQSFKFLVFLKHNRNLLHKTNTKINSQKITSNLFANIGFEF
ncbi:hypothetical protein RFI_32852 [Reticulomyxa filosa]|uniref:Kelch motif family protein n=1 Tax=Reticulomyxa filosa TaxID=46433 RepID=X6LTU8_RETFI|nr:hypothetical protein RFI_32852 [Reticulomyxa filosa]|eukprot:ETO04542.1 hypothetical protein RFI_32852 [Reticulomyxa filosa]